MPDANPLPTVAELVAKCRAAANVPAQHNRNWGALLVADLFAIADRLEALERECQSSSDTIDSQIARLAAAEKELARWQDYYGTDEPSDGVIGTAVGKIVAERNVEIAGLKARLAAAESRLARAERIEEACRTALRVGISPPNRDVRDLQLWNEAIAALAEPKEGDQ